MLFKWSTGPVDFTMVFPQSEIELPLFMKILPGIKVKGKDKRNKVLEPKKNIYGQNIRFKSLVSTSRRQATNTKFRTV